MNYTSFIVKIAGKPKRKYFYNNIIVTKMFVKYIPSRTRVLNTKDIFQISVWNKINFDTTKYYQLNDYILIEGYISLRPSKQYQKHLKKDKQIDISVTKHNLFFI